MPCSAIDETREALLNEMLLNTNCAARGEVLSLEHNWLMAGDKMSMRE